MTTQERKVMELALEALEVGFMGPNIVKYNQAITAIKEALAQPEQEPVAWITPDGEGFRIRFSPPVNDVPLGWDALYTTPPQRTWVGLTDEDKKQIAKEANYNWEMTTGEYAERIGRLTEAKLKEKNNA